MSDYPRNLTRRDFLKVGATTAAAAALGGLAAGPLQAQQDYEKRNIQPTMSYAPFGRTNLLISRLSIGGGPWKSAVVAAAIERGCNLVHGSHGYKTMPAQAKDLKGKWDKVYYALKGAVSQKNVDDCLKTLGVDHIDFILPVTGSPRGVDVRSNFEKFEKLKQAGKVRFLGLTIHGSANLHTVVDAAVKAGFWDCILTMYQPAIVATMNPALQRARQAKLGTMSMKTIQGMRASLDDRAKVIAQALGSGAIDTVLKGLGSLAELDAYAAAAAAAKTASRAETPSAQFAADPAVCGACGACLAACPAGIAIPDIMRCQTYYAPTPGLRDYARAGYAEIPPHRRATACLDCGQCEQVCPRELPIRSLLRQADRVWA